MSKESVPENLEVFSIVLIILGLIIGSLCILYNAICGGTVIIVVSLIIGFSIYKRYGYEQYEPKKIREPKKVTEIKPHRKRISGKLRWQLLKRDNFTCQFCGRTINETPLHLDHILPVSKGGMTVESNLQTLCEECNLKKSNK